MEWIIGSGCICTGGGCVRLMDLCWYMLIQVAMRTTG